MGENMAFENIIIELAEKNNLTDLEAFEQFMLFWENEFLR